MRVQAIPSIPGNRLEGESNMFFLAHRTVSLVSARDMATLAVRPVCAYLIVLTESTERWWLVVDVDYE